MTVFFVRTNKYIDFTYTQTHTLTRTRTHRHTHTLKESNFVCLDFVEFNISLDENINVNIIYKYKI